MLEAYTPGEQPKDMKYIKLNTNESPYPPSKAVFEAVNANEVANLRLYPDPEGKALKEKLAALYGVGAENIFLSNGSDDILNFAFMAFCENGAVFPEITYGFYEVFAELHGVYYEKIPLCKDFTIDAKSFMNQNKAIFIANPNAPTGIALSLGGNFIMLSFFSEIGQTQGGGRLILFSAAKRDHNKNQQRKQIRQHLENLI